MDHPIPTMSSLHTQVCIVGAGPAGCALALFLAKYHIPHILIEKESFPREKVCGDGLTLEVMHTLSQISPSLLKAFLDHPDFNPCWKAHFQGPLGIGVALDFSPDMHPYAPLYTGSRWEFDKFLWDNLDLKYTRTLSATKVVDLKRSTGECVVSLACNSDGIQKILSPIVIGADGSSSIVKRMLGKKSLSSLNPYRGVGIRAYGYTEETQDRPKSMKFFFFKDLLPGYFWVFPMEGNKVNVGIYLPAYLLKKKSVTLPKLLQNSLDTYNQSQADRQKIINLSKPVSWGLPLRITSSPLGGENYLLLGDAGSLIEPFTGKGIGLAMLSAKVAAKVLVRAIEKETHFPGLYLQYEDTIKRMYSREYLLSKMLHKAFSFSLGAHAILWLLSRNLLQPYWRYWLQKGILKWQH